MELNGKKYTVFEKSDGVLELVPEREKPRLWRLAPAEAHFVANHFGNVEEWIPEEDPFEEQTVEWGVFPTRELAERASPLFARTHKIILAALQVDPEAGGWTADRSHTVLRSHAGWHPTSRTAEVGTAFVRTLDQARQMAEILNAEGV